jgi:hypothetical protein
VKNGVSVWVLGWLRAHRGFFFSLRMRDSSSGWASGVDTDGAPLRCVYPAELENGEVWKRLANA